MHGAKTGITHTNHDDRKWIVGGLNNLINSLGNIHDFTVGDDHQDRVFLTVLGLLALKVLGVFVGFAEHWRELGRTEKFAFLERVLIACKDAVQPLNLRFINVTI